MKQCEIANGKLSYGVQCINNFTDSHDSILTNRRVENTKQVDTDVRSYKRYYKSIPFSKSFYGSSNYYARDFLR